MIVRAPHLQDDALYECYYAARRGEALDPPSVEHLADCRACAGRYAEIGTFLSALAEDADAEIDALFPPDRLRAQQQDIARRLQLVGRAARIITFPGRAAAAMSRAPQSSITRMAMRWIAVAAAAGLFVGVAAGTAFNFSPRARSVQSRRTGAAVTHPAAAQTPTRLSSPSIEKAAVVDMDDMFMSDLEAVLDRPHTRELVAFDALTPHIREVRDFAR